MEPRFLDLAEVIEIHTDQIERYGGAPGIRDLGLLHTAVAMPETTVGRAYAHTDLFEMAAAYLFHIARNHPFVDGNKRTAAAAALIFLDLNGIDIRATTDKLATLVEGTAAGSVEKSAATEFLRRHADARAGR